jgi:glycosyltransferase involved in cell wall biosynthesis
MRVLFISHAYVVGVNQGKLNAIAETGKVVVGLLAPSNWKAPEWNRQLPLERPYPNLHLYSAPVVFSGRGGAHMYAPWSIWQEVFSLSAFELAIWSRISGIPLVVFGWENLERRLPLPRWWTCQFVLNTVKAIVPGNQDGAKIVRNWGYQGTLAVMPQMGVDPDFFSPVTSEIAANPSESRSGDRPFNIGYMGRLARSKGIDLIFAVHQLRAQGLNCQITICGSGGDEQMLRDEADKQQIASAIVWRGAVRHEAVPAEMATFDVLVLPSRTTPEWKEQFGHVSIEAMAMGIPVVGSSSGEIPHVIGRSDLVFAEEDVDGLARILARTISNPQWREEVSQYGLQRVRQHYTHARIAEQLINLWHQVLA